MVQKHGCGDNVLPFGGYKEPGWGRERGRDALDQYLETKVVAGPL